MASRSQQPPFERVADALRDRIASGEFAPGDQLPSYSQIEAEYAVAITTAQRAIRTLKSEGLVEGKAGKGNYVRVDRQIVTLPASYVRADGTGVWTTWRAAAKEQGLEGTQSIDEATEIKAPPRVADALRLEDGAKVVVRRRTLRLSGHPVQLADTYFPAAVAKGTPLARAKKIPGGSAALLDEMGYRAARCDEFVSARMPGKAEIEALRLESGVPVIEQFRISLTAEDVPTQCEIFVLAADRHRLKYTLPGC